MNSTLLVPMAPSGRLGWARSAFGAFFGIALTALLCGLWQRTHSPTLPFLIAPMGASAVILFALPASPLAQPWPVIGGNLIAAVIGVACARLTLPPPLVAGIAVGSTIAITSIARCLHPPAGAVALVTVLGGPAVTAAGWSFILFPIGVNVAVLVLLGWFYNNLTGHAYPHQVRPGTSARTAPFLLKTYTPADLDAVLADYDEVLDISRDDLDLLFRRVEARVHARQKRRPRR